MNPSIANAPPRRIWLSYILAAVLIAVPSFCAAQNADKSESGKGGLYRHLLRSTALVLTPDGEGTAWVVDQQRGLLITNFHVVAKGTGNEINDFVTIQFPEYKNGRVIAERNYYEQDIDTPSRTGRRVTGRVLDALDTVDLALIQVNRLPEDVKAVPLAAQSASPGECLHSIGNPGGSDALWLYTEGAVKQVFQRSWAIKIGHRMMRVNARAVQTQAPTNPGDSGGPVVNDSGELVAVTHGGSTKASLLNLAIDVTEVRSYLAEVGWMASVVTADDYARRARHYFKRELFAPTGAARHNRLEMAQADLGRISGYAANSKYLVERAAVQMALSERRRAGLSGPMVTAPHVSGSGLFARLANSTDEAKAIADCQLAAQTPASAAQAHAQLGKIYSKPQLYSSSKAIQDTAMEEFQAALNIDPDCVEAYEGRYLHLCFKDQAQSQQDLDEIIRLRPESAWALITRAKRHAVQGDTELALQDFDRAIRLQPETAEFYISRARFYAETNQYGKAIADHMTVAQKLQPENVQNLQGLATCLKAVNESAAAVSVCGEALNWIANLDLPQEHPEELLLLRGDAYAANLEFDRARLDYLSAIETAQAIDRKRNEVARTSLLMSVSLRFEQMARDAFIRRARERLEGLPFSRN